jgi:uncharacterized protein DUF1524
MQRSVRATIATVLALPAVFLAAPQAAAEPPTPPSAETSRTQLTEITTAAEGPTTGYSRELFPHWSTVSGTCNTREFVLRRDGTNVVTDAACVAKSGSWYSPYDGATWYLASDIDIDHMVPLAEAWRSGANSWTTAQRQQFANDVESSQLWAVTDNVNQSKGDQDPGEWVPPYLGFHCMYARSWIDVKWRYDLTADPAEKTALTTLLDTC